jgi:hypothetical protein
LLFFALTTGLLFGATSVFAACNSNIFCATIYDPVCGTDGQSYSNACFASAACVEVDYIGVCREPPPACIDRDNDQFSPRGGECGPVDCNDLDPNINPDMACPEIYEPVCGVDGRTYSSTCEALRVCVSVDHPGECIESPVCVDQDEDGYSPDGGDCGPIDCDDIDPSRSPGAICTTEVSPVCGVDGNTYGNACEANRQCVEIAHPGVCETPPVCTERPDLVCTTEYDPVCGVNGRTYGNDCEAMRACIEIAHRGECVTPACKVSNDVACTADYDPVCGVDGRSYGNACEAGRVCVEIAHRGECLSREVRPNPTR